MCTLVVVGVRADGKKELVALADGHRESTESWADLLRDARRRGMRAPVLAVGDGALGFWAALREVFPDSRAARLGAQGRQRVNGPHPVALVRAGAKFEKGELIERPDEAGHEVEQKVAA